MYLNELIWEIKYLGVQIDELNEMKKALQERYDQLRLFDIPNTMAENNDIRSITGDFGRCTLSSDLHVKVIGGKVELHKWLEDSGNGDLIVPTVNAQTLKAFCKEQLQNGEQLPEEVLAISPFTRAVIYAK